MKYVIWFVILVVVVGGGSWWWHMHADAAAANAAPQYQTAKVTRKDIKLIVQSQGQVSSNRDVDIKCKASGNITKLPYKDVSSEVKPGELLLQLDTLDEVRLLDSADAVVEADQARLDEAKLNAKISAMSLDTTRQRDEAALASAKAQSVDAHAKSQRTEELFNSKLASKEDLETAQTTAALADASVMTAQAAIAELDQQAITVQTKQQEIQQMDAQLRQDQTKEATAKQNVDYCTVTAPLPDPVSEWWPFTSQDPPQWRISVMTAGVAIGYLVQSGSSGSSGGTTVMTLSDISHLFVVATVAESDVGTLRQEFKLHQSHNEDLPVIIQADAYKNVTFAGKVVLIAEQGKTVNNVTTFDVRIEVTSPYYKLLLPNMTASVWITTSERDDVLTVPAAAVSTHKKEGKDGDTTRPSAPQTTAVVAADESPAAPTTHARHNGGKRKNGSTPGGSAPGGNNDGEGMGLDNVPKPASVTIQKADGTTETREIMTGLTDGLDTEVISGLDENDTVVLTKGGGDSKWKGNNPGAGGPNVRGMMGGGRGF